MSSKVEKEGISVLHRFLKTFVPLQHEYGSGLLDLVSYSLSGWS